MGLIHDHIISRAPGSNPGSDLRQLGFDSDALFNEILDNEDMTVNMVTAMTFNRPLPPQQLLAEYAMTWLAVGAAIYKEKRDGTGPDSISAGPDEQNR